MIIYIYILHFYKPLAFRVELFVYIFWFLFFSLFSPSTLIVKTPLIITPLGGIEKPKHPKSIIGLFRRESSSSTQGPEAGTSDSEKGEGSMKGDFPTKGEPSQRHVPSLLSKRSTSLGGPSVLLMEDVAHSDPLGASSRPASIMQGPHRGQCRRGSMLELTGYVFPSLGLINFFVEINLFSYGIKRTCEWKWVHFIYNQSTNGKCTLYCNLT